MQSHFLGLGIVLLLVASPFTSEPVPGHRYQRYGYYGGGGRNFGGGGGGGILQTAGLALGAAALVGGAIVLKSALLNSARGYGKKRRSADGLYEEDEETNRYDEALSYFDLAMELDGDTCVEKTLCEIMASTEDEKNPSEIVKILDTIYSGKLPVMGQPGHEDATSLLMAGYLGKINKSKDFCDNTFKMCQKDSAIRQKYLKQEYELVKKLD